MTEPHITITPPPGPGDNLPPVDADPLRERLVEQYAPLTARRDELLAGCLLAPDVIRDDEADKELSDFLVQIHKAMKRIEANRTEEKEVYLAGGRTVDGFFKSVHSPLNKWYKTLDERLTYYKSQKEQAERRRREEEQRKADEIARLAAEEAARQAAAITKESDLNLALRAEERAVEAAAVALKARQAAQAKAAELSRTRSDHGSVSGLRVRWTGHYTERAKLDLEALREHLSDDALNQAIRSFVKRGGRELKGAYIYEAKSTQVR
jgi:hypothetical protein